jgi:hypothetical protein
MSQKHDAETWTGEWDSANDVTLNPPPHVIDLAIEVSGLAAPHVSRAASLC